MFHKYRLMFNGDTKDITFLVKLTPLQVHNAVSAKGAYNMAYMGASCTA